MKKIFLFLLVNLLLSNVFCQDIFIGQTKENVEKSLKSDNRQIVVENEMITEKKYTFHNYQFDIISYIFKENKLALIALVDYYEKAEYKNKEIDFFKLSYELKQSYTLLKYKTKFLDYDKLFQFRHTFDDSIYYILTIRYNKNLKLCETVLRFESSNE